MSDNNESVIDLTNCSYTLADHCRLNDVIIYLDSEDSFREGLNTQNVNFTTIGAHGGVAAEQHTRKRRSKRRGGINPETPVHDLCTPEVKSRKRTSQSKKVLENKSFTEEPTEEPKAKKPKSYIASCPICLDEFYGQELASTKCGHVFCLKCLKMALKKESKCPTCRTILKGSSRYHPIFL